MELKLEDCMCPICMCILVEPVTMPCTHTLCYPCFKQNVEDTSLTCPMCRTRISNWARRASKSKTLINRKFWVEIQSLFPDKVKRRQEGSDEDNEELEEAVFQPVINIAQPGEIRQEYEEQLNRLREQREMEHKKEQEASELLIRRLQEEESRKEKEAQERELRDLELAQQISKQVQEGQTRSRSAARSSSTASPRSTGSSRPPSTIESFISKMREAERLKEEDRAGAKSPKSTSPYPYTCYTPTEKGKKTLTEVTKTPQSRSVSSVGVQSRSLSTTSRDSDVQFLTEFDKILPKPIDLTQSPFLLDDTVEEKIDSERCKSTESCDSIGDELRHFAPIRSYPTTPPRKLPSGKVVEPALIRTTPRNLSKSGLGSPVLTLKDIDASSPIMQRRLSELEEERKQNVNKFSKSTSTVGSGFTQDHSYSGQEGKSGVEHNYSANVIDLEEEGERGRLDGKSDMKLKVKEECNSGLSDLITRDIKSENQDVETKPDLPKMVIPLEPNLDDVDDFDIAPLVEINISNIKSETGIKEAKKRKRANSRNVSDTSLVRAEVRSPVAKRRRNVSSKSQNKNIESIFSPQRSIRDWMVKGPSCGGSGDHNKLFQETAQSATRDDVDGDIGRRGRTIDRLQANGGEKVSSKTTDSGDGKNCLKSYPLRKRRKCDFNHGDFIIGNWNTKTERKKISKLCANGESGSDADSDCESNTSYTNSEASSTSEVQHLARGRQFLLHDTVKGKKGSSRNKTVVKRTQKLKTLRKSREGSAKQTLLNVHVEPQPCVSSRRLRNNSETNSWKAENSSEADHFRLHSVSDFDANLDSSVFDDMSEREKQEYADRKLAEEIAKQFELEAKMKMQFIRTKGSTDEYNFRRKTRVLS